MSALYSAALQMKQIDDVEKHLRALQGELRKPTMVDFVETSMISRAAKAKLLEEVGAKAGKVCISSIFTQLQGPSYALH